MSILFTIIPDSRQPALGQVRLSYEHGLDITMNGGPNSESPFVFFEDPKIAFILGPQVIAGDGKIDGTSKSVDRVPWPWIDRNGVLQEDSPYPATGIPAEPRTGYMGAINVPTDYTAIGTIGATGVLESLDSYLGYSVYYDFPLVLWINYFRTGDFFWRDKAIAHSNCRIHVGGTMNGLIPTSRNCNTAPRSLALAGVIVTALYEDATLTGTSIGGLSSKWDGLATFIDYLLFGWVTNRYRNNTSPTGIRDPEYILYYAAILGRVLPDTYLATWTRTGNNKMGIPDAYTVGDTVNGLAVRQGFIDKVATFAGGRPEDPLDSTTPGYFGRLQHIDGPPQIYNVEQSLNGCGNGCQPWQAGITAEAWINSYKLLSFVDAVRYDQQLSEIKSNLILLGKYMWATYRKAGTFNGTNQNNVNAWRDSPYITHTQVLGAMRLTGVVDLTPDSGNNVTNVVGSNTLFLTEGCYDKQLLYFREELTGTLTIAGGGTSTKVSITNGLASVAVPDASFMSGFPTHEGVEFRILNSSRTVIETRIIKTVTDATHIILDQPVSTATGRYDVSWSGSVNVLGVDTLLDTECSPGDMLLVQTDFDNYKVINIASITSATRLVLAKAPDRTLQGSGKAAFFNCYYPVRGTFTVGTINAGRATLTGDVASRFTEDLSENDLMWLLDADNKEDLWTVSNVISDTEVVVSSIASGSANLSGASNWTGSFVAARRARVGEARGPFRLQGDPTSELLATITPAYPGSTLSNRVIALPISGSTNGNFGNIRDRRQTNWSLPNLFGWLYHATGDNAWKTRGDEVMSSIWGRSVGPGADSSYALWDYYIKENSVLAGRLKEFDEMMRSSTKYLAYRLGGS